jgi:hypothetical protein
VHRPELDIAGTASIQDAPETNEKPFNIEYGRMHMKEKLISVAITAAIAAPMAAQAGSLTVANQDITLSGGLAGGYVYNTDTKKDAFTATDALVDLSSEAKSGGVGFDLGVGVLAGANFLENYAGATPVSSGTLNSATSGSGTALQYGYLTIMPTDNLSLQAGTLATNVGYEVVPSYSNANIVHGLVWGGEPAYYNGVRATYSMNNMSVYAEANRNALGTNSPGSGVGASGSFGGVDLAVNYFNRAEATSGPGGILDLIASGKAGNFSYAVNIDYLQKSDRLKKATSTTDDNAYGVALYASMPMGANASLPIRIEYVNDGTSGLYNLPAITSGSSNTAITFTITPTYNFSDSTFVRAELAYISTDKKTPMLVDDKGLATDSNLTVGFQGGLLF